MGEGREFAKFCLVGAFTFFIDYGLLFACTEYAGISYLISSGISFSVAVLVNYLLCATYVFKDAEQNLKSLMGFIVVSCIGLILNQCCMWFMVEKIQLYYMLAKIVSTAIVTLWNYFGKKYALQ